MFISLLIPAVVTTPPAVEACSEKPEPMPGMALLPEAPKSPGFYCKNGLFFTHI